MQIRRARMDELDRIMQMYEAGRQFMRAHGNLEQWTGGYPQRELIEKDCQEGILYLCEENREPLAVFMYREGTDPTYGVIDSGVWLEEERPYAVIHRIVSTAAGKGAASFCVNWGVQQSGNLRIDTHETNFPMQNMLKKNGFVRCGIVYMSDGSPRVAFQKIQKD
ncbi:MAG: GNAT family N-acetyltransferase [bacterium]|nr:GNAT family N-acetyltransferase [bacterium]